MTKSVTLLAFCFLLIISCQKNDAGNPENDDVLTSETISQRCASHEILEEKLAADPSLRSRMQQIEDYTQKVIKKKHEYKLLSDGTIEIPVYYHVLYRTADENISDAQLQSQIDVLNEDFQLKNTDISKVPSHFIKDTANVKIRFTWSIANTKRKYVNKRSWQVNDDMKFDANGGSNVVEPQNYLNIWVVNKMTYMGQTILGFAQFPGGNWATDGVVLGHNYTGRTGKVSAPYNLGRTATHEVGHWINLRHIWGDATCGDDFVGDTPQHNTSNGGCPAANHKSTCSGTPLEMWMNYMDYTYDQCMYMFTKGQRDRMRSQFASGAFRQALGTP